MIGRNKMQINQATMREAVQLWLDSKLKVPAPKVDYVEWKGSSPDCFEITLESVEPNSTGEGS